MAPLIAMVAQRAVTEGSRWWEPNPWMGWVALAGMAVGIAWAAWDMWRGN